MCGEALEQQKSDLCDSERGVIVGTMDGDSSVNGGPSRDFTASYSVYSLHRRAMNKKTDSSWQLVNERCLRGLARLVKANRKPRKCKITCNV